MPRALCASRQNQKPEDYRLCSALGIARNKHRRDRLIVNVPFRLIFAQNLSRVGVLNNQLQPQKGFQFRFAVGTTF